MRITVVGAGAMGGALAVALAGTDQEVSVLDTSSALVERAREAGIGVTDAEGTVVRRLAATTEAAEIGESDLVVVFVKSTQTAAVAGSILPLVGTETTVVSLQNGWGNAQVLADRLGADRLVYGVTYNSCSSTRLGEIAHTGRGHTFVGDFAGGAVRAAPVAEVLDKAGWSATATSSVANEIWKKLVLNSVSLPLASLTRLPAGSLVEVEEVWALAEALVRESCAVAAANGLEVDVGERIAQTRATLVRAGAGLPSMLQDVRARRATEIDVVSGAIVRAAEATGIDAPLNRAMASLVLGLERSWAREDDVR